ncbi:hypothetical protein M5K25_004120 [Dendrobium thyrsiflorum]|uniref:Endonuclease/exonuclease/phosphatase domain-containing protein n=1 Tax=Dendrobium thyrsiflorum TaxID=117978 RepID=A0ABD0VL30_DENTH
MVAEKVETNLVVLNHESEEIIGEQSNDPNLYVSVNSMLQNINNPNPQLPITLSILNVNKEVQTKNGVLESGTLSNDDCKEGEFLLKSNMEHNVVDHKSVAVNVESTSSSHEDSDSKVRVRNSCRMHNIHLLVLSEPFILLDKLVITTSCLGFSINSNNPWCVGGDFNTISNTSDRIDGNPPNQHAMNDFNSMITDCNLHDTCYFGGTFTWDRATMWQRLDRILFNTNWIVDLLMTHVKHLSRTNFDHVHLLLSIKTNISFVPSSFRFQNMWLLDNGFMNMIHIYWHAPITPDYNIMGMSRLWSKLSRLKQKLRWFVFKNIFSNNKEVENKVIELDKVYLVDPINDNLISLNKAKVGLFELQEQEETFWRQKATSKLILEGDRNTKFFHALANKKRLRTKPPSELEIWNTIKEINVDSVAGPDSFTTKFF